MSLLNKVRANNSKEAQTIGKQCSTNSAAINKTSPSTKQFSVQEGFLAIHDYVELT